MRLDLGVVLRHAAQFQHVAPTLFTVGLLAQFGAVAAALGNPVHQFGQLQFFHSIAKVHLQCSEGCQGRFRRFAQRGMLFDAHDGVVGRDMLLVGPVLKFTQRFRANLAVGHVDDALQAQVVIGVDQQAQVGDHVFDFFALIEFAAADDLVGDIQAHELLFQGTGLGVSAVHDGDIAPLLHFATRQQAQDLVTREEAFLFLIVGFMHDDLLARTQVRPQAFVLAQPVALHHVLGGIQDVLRRAVVLFQQDYLLLGKIAL